MSFYKFARGFVRGLSHVFFPVKVHGNKDSIPLEGGLILCANHLSYLDAIFLGLSVKREIRFIGKDKYANAFMLKSIFKWLGAFGINPEKPDLTAIKNCFKVVKSGEVLGIFPEGTRILKGKISNPMPGAVMIAHKTKTPLFYVRIKPKKGVFKLFRKTDVYIGKSVTVEELGVTNGRDNEYKNASVLLMERVYGLGEQCQ